MITQQPLMENCEAVEPFDWSGHAVSLSFDERRIIRWIIDLHNGGQPFDVDPCYSVGRFWEGLPGPRLKFDLVPQLEGVEQADVRSLPLASESVKSIMFDPPFICGEGPSTQSTETIGKMKGRFGFFKNTDELWAFYDTALAELHRILSRPGLLVFKCQDMIDTGKQRLSHVFIINAAELRGFYCKDMFVLGRNSVMWSPNMKHQQHARKNHCYFLVLVKR